LKDTPRDSLLLIGKVLRPHGLRGLLKIESYAHSRTTFLEARTLFIRAISGKLIEFTVSSVSPYKNSLLIKLDGLDQKEEAENLRGAEIFIKKGSLVRNEDEYFWHEILKLGVYLESGSYLGIVSQIISTGGNDIYVIKDGKREILIPATHEVIKEIDLEKRIMIITPMEGLLDLNEI